MNRTCQLEGSERRSAAAGRDGDGWRRPICRRLLLLTKQWRRPPTTTTTMPTTTRWPVPRWHRQQLCFWASTWHRPCTRAVRSRTRPARSCSRTAAAVAHRIAGGRHQQAPQPPPPHRRPLSTLKELSWTRTSSSDRRSPPRSCKRPDRCRRPPWPWQRRPLPAASRRPCSRPAGHLWCEGGVCVAHGRGADAHVGDAHANVDGTCWQRRRRRQLQLQQRPRPPANSCTDCSSGDDAD